MTFDTKIEKTDIDKKNRFRNFSVYKNELLLNKEVKVLCQKKFPKEEVYGLSSQLQRALDSILLNIAEGSERSTDKDVSLFLSYSLASVNEVVACLDSAESNKYISQK